MPHSVACSPQPTQSRCRDASSAGLGSARATCPHRLDEHLPSPSQRSPLVHLVQAWQVPAPDEALSIRTPCLSLTYPVMRSPVREAYAPLPSRHSTPSRKLMLPGTRG